MRRDRVPPFWVKVPRGTLYTYPTLRNSVRCRHHVGVAEPSAEQLARSQAIRELLDVRDGVCELPGLTRDEIVCVVNNYCIM